MVSSQSREPAVSVAKALPSLIKEPSNSLDLRNPASTADVLAMCPITLQPGQLEPRRFNLSVLVAISSWITQQTLILNSKGSPSPSSLLDQSFLLGFQSRECGLPTPIPACCVVELGATTPCYLHLTMLLSPRLSSVFPLVWDDFSWSQGLGSYSVIPSQSNRVTFSTPPLSMLFRCQHIKSRQVTFPSALTVPLTECAGTF